MRAPSRWVVLGAILLILAVAGGIFLLREKGEGPSALRGGPGEAEAVDLYFADAEEGRLAIERRPLAPGTAEEKARAIGEELILGPRDPALTSTIPPTAEVRAVYLRGDTAYLDFTAPLSTAHPGGSWNEALTVYSIVNSIAANVPGVERVQILVEGREGESLAGHIVLDRPLSPQPRLLDGNL